MPKKVLPTPESFAWFSGKLTDPKIGFRQIPRHEFRTQLRRLGLRAPRRREGREVGFTFTTIGLTVVVWTTWISEWNHAREEDAGWVLIAEGDNVLYFAPPVSRTKHFFRNLGRKAWLAWFRVSHRPLCSECDAFMDIVRGRAMKARYWRCGRREMHEDGRVRRLDWDFGLGPKALAIAREMREERERYRKRVRAAGKEPFAALFIRKPWVVKKPQNIVVVRSAR